MKQRIMVWLLGVVLPVAVPVMVLAQETAEDLDGRLRGYKENVQFGGSSVALSWLLLIFLGAVCLSVMFMDAKRSHMD